MSSIFISHSSANNAEALALREWLVGQGWDNLFLDIDPKRGIVAGDRWRKALVDAGGRTKATLFVITPSWLESEECRTEFRIASGHEQPLFGVIVVGTELSSIPNEMTSQWQLVDLTKGDEFETFSVNPPPEFKGSEVRYSKQGLQSLRQGLLKLGLLSLETTSFPWPAAGYDNDEDRAPRAPWRGLRAIDEPDAGVFFGRDGDLHRAMDRLGELRSVGGRKLWVILGASGAGKSSFMRAGLMPRLKRTDSDYCVLPIIRPEGAVITGRQGLVAAVERGLRDQGITVEWAAVRKELRDDTSALSRRLAEIQNAAAAARLGEPKAPTLILPIDQAEELFQPTATEAKQFITALAETLRYGRETIVIATIRTDAYAPLQSSVPLRDLQLTFSLPPMGRGGYRATIEGPAERVTAAGRELTVTPTLVERLVADAEGSDALPLLAFTLERLYHDYGGDNRLDDADYDDLGGIKGAVEAAVKAAFDKPEEAPRIPSDPAERRDLLYQAFPWLVGVNESNGAALRRVAHWNDIPTNARCLIERLINRRLLRTDEDDNKRRIVEIAHEALLRQWRTLTEWLDQEKDNLRAIQAVLRAATEWESRGRNAEWLLHKAGRLVTAEELESRRSDLAKVWGDVGQQYLKACRAEETVAAEAEKEGQQKLLDAEREVSRRRARQVRWAWSFSGAAVVLMGLAAWQFFLARQNEFTALTNEAASLAAFSQSENQNSPALALKLAIAAWPRSTTDQYPQTSAAVDAIRSAMPLARGIL